MTVVYYKVNYLPVGVRIWFRPNSNNYLFWNGFIPFCNEFIPGIKIISIKGFKIIGCLNSNYIDKTYWNTEVTKNRIIIDNPVLDSTHCYLVPPISIQNLQTYSTNCFFTFSLTLCHVQQMGHNNGRGEIIFGVVNNTWPVVYFNKQKIWQIVLVSCGSVRIHRSWHNNIPILWRLE